MQGVEPAGEREVCCSQQGWKDRATQPFETRHRTVGFGAVSSLCPTPFGPLFPHCAPLHPFGMMYILCRCVLERCDLPFDFTEHAIKRFLEFQRRLWTLKPC